MQVPKCLASQHVAGARGRCSRPRGRACGAGDRHYSERFRSAQGLAGHSAVGWPYDRVRRLLVVTPRQGKAHVQHQAPRVHDAAQRRGRGVAARGARAAGDDGGTNASNLRSLSRILRTWASNTSNLSRPNSVNCALEQRREICAREICIGFSRVWRWSRFPRWSRQCHRLKRRPHPRRRQHFRRSRKCRLHWCLRT